MWQIKLSVAHIATFSWLYTKKNMYCSLQYNARFRLICVAVDYIIAFDIRKERMLWNLRSTYHWKIFTLTLNTIISTFISYRQGYDSDMSLYVAMFY